jgi:GT2 family glycosyltransferase
MLFSDVQYDVMPRRAARLATGVMLLSLPDDASCPIFPGVSPPYGTVAVNGTIGPHRIAALRWGAAGDTCVAALPGHAGTIAEVADAAHLAEELDPASCRRLLGFLLGFCRTAFSLSTEPGFARSCVRLARLCARHMGEATPVARATSSWMVLSGIAIPPGAILYSLDAGGVRLNPAPAIENGAGVHLIEPVRRDTLLLAMGDQPALWTIRSPSGPLLDVLTSPRRRAGDSALRGACLRALARTGDMAALVSRDAQIFAPATPRRHDNPASPIGASLEAALPDGEGGLFLRGWLRDPLDLVTGFEIRTPFATRSFTPGRLHPMNRPDLTRHFATSAFRDEKLAHGFVAHIHDPANGLCPQPGMAFILRSGNVIEVTPPVCHLPPGLARDAVLSSVPPGQATVTIMEECIAPAAAALHRAALASGRDIQTVQIGKPVARPEISIVVPLYQNLGFLRFQAAAFAADPECRTAELIYILDSPRQRDELENLLRGLNVMHDLPFTMVVTSRNLGYAAANNAAATVARGRTLLLLNSDVVPAGPGWLGRMHAVLKTRGIGAVGPKLLFDDGSIQHAGLYFKRDGEGMWYNAHYHKGMPRHWPDASAPRKVPGVTGAALMVRRHLFDAVGGICEDYIVGDYEDSDFCLRLRDAGAGIAYVPDAELYHFERRSIQQHPGYAGTLASLYNRRLHHHRWDDVMTAHMNQAAFQAGA